MSKNKSEGGFADSILADFTKAQKAKSVVSENTVSVPTTKLGAASSAEELIRRVPIIEIDPAVCEPWSYHNRDRVWLNKYNCKDLINSISKVGQQEPVLIRKAKEGSAYKYDVIYGVRRWFACKEIKGQKLLAKLTEASDRECMILMHIENADSKDISDFERAYSFRVQYKTGVFVSQNDFAEAMNISKGMVTKLFTAAELADYPWFSEFVTNKVEVPLIKAYKIASSLRNKFTKEFVDSEISKLRENLMIDKKGISTGKFINYLESIIFRDDSDKKKLIDELSSKTHNFTVKIDTKNKLTVQVKPGLNKKEASALLEKVMDVYYS